MRAVTTHQGRLEVAEVPDLEPGPGQILLDVLRCGICGSDLHARTSGDITADALGEMGYADFMRAADTVVLGHEFAGTVALARTADYWDAEAEALLNKGFNPRTRQWTDPEARARFDKMGGDEAYHYLGSGKLQALIGHSMGEAMKKLPPP